MPGSIRENNDDLIAFVHANQIRTVLDVGVGRGTYSRILRRHVERIDGIEAWEPYVEQYALRSRYATLTLADVRDLAAADSRFDGYDLVIFGDVLEHMTPTEAAEVWTWAHGVASWGMISLPREHWPQGAERGNPFEAHDHEHITGEDLVAPGHPFGPFDHAWSYPRTTTVIRRFA